MLFSSLSSILYEFLSKNSLKVKQNWTYSDPQVYNAWKIIGKNQNSSKTSSKKIHQIKIRQKMRQKNSSKKLSNFKEPTPSNTKVINSLDPREKDQKGPKKSNLGS